MSAPGVQGRPHHRPLLTSTTRLSSFRPCETRRRFGIITIITRPGRGVWRRWSAPDLSLQQTEIATAARLSDGPRFFFLLFPES